jgi:CrcB protein
VSLAVWAGVAALGGLGAVARFLVDLAVSARAGRSFPWGILAVNLSGTFALGLLVGAAVRGDALELAGTGLLGAYTTFSTWMLDSHRLGRRGGLDLAGSLALGLLAAWLGRELGGGL